MTRLLLILLGGALGSGCRYLAGVWIAERLGTGFPWGTFTVNVAGSLLIGVVATLADEVGRVGLETRMFLVAGFLGGFTTFSSFALEGLRLNEQRDLMRAFVYVGATLIAGFSAAALGVAATRAVAR